MSRSALPQKINSFSFFIFGFAILLLPVGFIVWKVMKITHGVFMYPYDDTFIHLTIADNLLKGTWGINENEFASASSSPLYTLILTFFRLFSKTTLTPFIVNCLAGAGIVIALHSWLKKHFVNSIGQAAILLLVVFFTPLPLLIVSGMEHTLQCLFSFLFIFYFSDWLADNKTSNKALPVKILIFSVLTSTIRYEGLFLIGIACVLLLLHRKFLQSFLLGFVALLPLIVYGLISLSKGNYFLPNSVLVKSGSFNYSSPVQFIYDILFDKLVYARNGMAALATQRLTIAIPLLYFLFRKYFYLVLPFCNCLLPPPAICIDMKPICFFASL
jgi:hypothetical protein